MPRYVAFLRAVNVGGRQVKMERLREVVAGLGYDDVATYIASGNLFFTTKATDRKKIVAVLEKALEAEWGFEIPVILRTVEEIEATVASTAFSGHELTPQTRHLVIFHGEQAQAVEMPYVSKKGDVTVVDATDGELFMVLTVVDGRWPSDTQEKAFGIKRGTARFAHTLVKILAAAQK